MSETWTIAELAERASGLLQAEPGDGSADGRVRGMPNERSIRWYSTIGLVDPPLTRRGRIARYGPRHLLQLVAIKRLQASGRSVADIQAMLTGATDAQLASVAGLPPDGLGLGSRTGAKDAEEAADRRHRDRFWAASAAAPAAYAPAASTASATVPAASRPRPPAAPAAAAELVPGIRLAPGVTVVVEGGTRTPMLADLEALAAASAPLLAALRDRGLLTPSAGHATDPEPSPPEGSAT